MRWTCLVLALALVGNARAFNFEGLSDAEIRRQAGEAFRADAAAFDTPDDRAATLDAVLQMLETRAEIFEALGAARSLDEMGDIWFADSLDDSLTYHLGEILIPYEDANPKPILNPGTERFRETLSTVGFVREFATGFLVNLELTQSLYILADFRANRSAAEIEAAEDAFLRHFALYARLYRAQHTELMDLHQCNITNLEWVVGRVRSETGTDDFVVTNQLFAFRDTGFSYLLTLTSPTTGESIQAHYPLPWLTEMDEGWQKMKAAEREKAGAGG